MKKICFSSCIVLFVSMLFLLGSFAQDTPQWQLPEGVKSRIGKGEAWDIALSPDNGQLAVTTGIGVWLYDTQTGTEIALLAGHTSEINSVAYSPDGKTLASGSFREIRLWDPSTQEHKTTFAHQGTHSLAYSPDGKTLAVARWRDVDLLNAQTGERQLSLSGHRESVRFLVFSSDGKKLASASEGGEDTAVRVWNPRTGKLLRTLTGHDRSLHSLVFSSDSEILVGGGRDGAIHLWNANTGKNIGTVKERSDSLALSPDGRRIAISQGGDIHLLNANTGVLQQKLSGHTNDSSSLVFSLDSSTLVSSSSDGTIRFWNVGTSSLRLTIEGHFNFEGVALSPNGKTVATASESRIFLWNTLDGRFSNALDAERRIRALAYSPDGKTLAISIQGWGDGPRIRLLNPRTGQSRRTLRWEGSDARVIVFSPNSKILASVSRDRTIRVWNAGNGKLQKTLTGHTTAISSLVFSPDSKILASAGWDRTIRLWNAQTGQLQRKLEGHRNGVLSLAFSPNGSTLVSGNWDEIRFWNPRTGELQHAFEDARGEALAFSPDSKTLATGGWRVIHLRNASTGEFQRAIPLQSNVNWLAFTPDGKTLISGGWERTVLLWNMNALLEPTQGDVSRNNSQPQVLIAQSQRPPMYWVEAGTLHRLTGAKVETLVSSVQRATSLAVDMADAKLYWMEKTSDRTGKIRRANLDGTNVQLVKDLTSVPLDIALDTMDRKLYLTNAWGKIQRLNVDGSNFQPNLITNLDTPRNLVLDVAGGKVYWTETTEASGRIRRANLDGSSVQNVATGLAEPLSLAVANGKIYWTEGTTENAGELQRANLDGTNNELLETLSLAPTGIAVDTGRNSLYLTIPSGEIHRRDLNGSGYQPIVTGLVSPSNIVLGITATTSGPIDAPEPPATPTVDAAADVNQDQKVNKTDLLLVVTALGEKPPTNPSFDVNADGAVNIADVLLVIEALDDPVAAAAPSLGETGTSLDPALLTAQIDILRIESDGSMKYAHAIAFFQGLLASIRPTETRFLANYPNPFNPETWIPYHLANPSNVRITIYDIRGSIVRRLDLGPQREGYYTNRSRAAYWDGRNALGETVASGVYFYTLTAGEFTATRKMLIRK